MNIFRLAGKFAGKVENMHIRETVGRAIMRLGEKVSPEPRNSISVSDSRFMVKNLELSVVGVTFDGRQSIIRGLKGDEEANIVRVPTKKYPNRIVVLIGGHEVGFVSDMRKNSVSKWLIDEMEYGYSCKVISWRKVGGKYEGSRIGLRVTISLYKKGEILKNVFNPY